MHFRTQPLNSVGPVPHAKSLEALDIQGLRAIAIDGMWGVDFDRYAAAFPGFRTVRTWDYLKPSAQLEAQFRPWLTDNPVFGKVCQLPLSSYFDVDRLSAAIQETPVLVVGPWALGALPKPDLAVYCDLPRAEAIARLPQRGVSYKDAYYVEWPLLEAHRRELLQGARFDYYVDVTGVVVSFDALVTAVESATEKPFRCTPFFMPGVWGGQRLREVADLPKEWPNCAWDFEIVAPENSLPIDLGGASINVPMNAVLNLRARELMGELNYRMFGEYFPLRVNYLDTMGGTNLSLQVHPHHTYMRENFGEPIGQDESYYIVEKGEGAKVYLGLQESATRESLREAVRKAEEASVPFEITDYVNGFDANVGDLFLIPAGTVHCSGTNNLVLEISTTPYWYTFKIYDYLRPDLSGKPRPINSEHGFNVIDTTRKTEWVRRHLIPEPYLLRKDAGGEEHHIGTTGLTFYSVHRLHIQTEMADATDGGFLLLTVTAGEGARLLDQAGQPVAEIAYLETFVVPAAFGPFRIQAANGPCQVVKTYVRK